jgi:dihydroorotate dehydrogenase (fumarate)
MADLSTTYMGIKLRNPIIAASSGLTNSVDSIVRLRDAGIGAVVLKSLFEEQISHADKMNFQEYLNANAYPEVLDYINRKTDEQDVERYLNLVREAKKAVDIPIIASINCMTTSEWVYFAKKVQDAGADALELNIFLLPSDPRRKSEQTEQVYFDIIKSVLKQVNIPVAVKISYYFSGFANTALQLSWTGIQGLVLFNRFYSPDIDIDNFEITASNVFSNPSEVSMPLRWVALLSKRVQCDIAASTGIHDGGAVVKQLLAGAKAVQVASVLYKQGFDHIGVMLNEITAWMEKQEFDEVSDFLGMMSFREDKSMAAYERVQFMKHFSGIE